MNSLPYCRLLATGLDVRGLQDLSANYSASTGYRFPSGRSWEVDIPRTSQPLLFGIAAKCIAPHVRAEIGAIGLFRIAPGDVLPPHRDSNHTIFDETFPIRLQVIISAGAGCQFFIGTETIEHREGDLWDIRGTTTVLHHARNGSDRDRTIACLNVACPKE